MSAEHTPGPWTVNLSPNTKHPSLIAMVVNADNEQIFGINTDHRGARRVGKDTLLANAKLIASAPALAEENQKLRTLLRRSLTPLFKFQASFAPVQVGFIETGELIAEIRALDASPAATLEKKP